MREIGLSVLLRCANLKRKICLLTILLVAVMGTAWASSQRSIITPSGHEWITAVAGREALGDPSIWSSLEDDPRKVATFPRSIAPPLPPDVVARMRAQTVPNADPNHYYYAGYKSVFSAVVGQRWVDIGGFNVSNALAWDKTKVGVALNLVNGGPDAYAKGCFDPVAQLPDDIQEDHFLRTWNQTGFEGIQTAAIESRDRFITYFVAAADAPAGDMKVWDGGTWAESAVVDRQYFLLGRALHLLQDSYSQDHTDRPELRGAPDDRVVFGIHSYACTMQSDQHPHYGFVAFTSGNWETMGDIIWKARTQPYSPGNVKVMPMEAIEASKEAFIYFTMAINEPDPLSRHNKAVSYAREITAHYLRLDQNGAQALFASRNASPPAGYVKDAATQQACLENLPGGRNYFQTIEEDRRWCLWNILPASATSEYDIHLHIPYDWKWRNDKLFEKPPDSFKTGEIWGKATFLTTLVVMGKSSTQFVSATLMYDSVLNMVPPSNILPTGSKVALTNFALSLTPGLAGSIEYNCGTTESGREIARGAADGRMCEPDLNQQPIQRLAVRLTGPASLRYDINYYCQGEGPNRKLATNGAWCMVTDPMAMSFRYWITPKSAIQ